jgi:hypothetical protein
MKGNRSKKVPNPNGKLGDALSKSRTAQVTEQIKKRGNLVELESRVLTPHGMKKSRYADLAEIDPITKKVIKYHQIGKLNKDGTPIAREREASADIQKSTNKKVEFHDKNSNKGSTSSGGSNWSFGSWWSGLWN